MTDRPARMTLTRAQQPNGCDLGLPHTWLDVTVLQDCGRVARYVCGRCRAEAEEPFVQPQAKAPQ